MPRDKALQPRANPAGLPLERPSKFKLTIDTKTARARGPSIPRAPLIQADQVIKFVFVFIQQASSGTLERFN